MDIMPILASLRHHKITALLVILEIALTCAIVCNSVFLISQRIDRMNMPSGVAEDEVIQIQTADIGRRADTMARAREDLAAIEKIAGVKAVALSNQVPFGRSSNNSTIKLDPNQKTESLNATMYQGQDVVQALGAQVIAGRDLTHEDNVDLSVVIASKLTVIPKVVVISSGMAEKLWPGQGAVGKTIYLGDKPLMVVGVLRHLVRPSIWDWNTADYSIVIPMRIGATPGTNYIIRTAPVDRERVLQQAVAALKVINPNRLILKKRSFDEVRREYFQDDRSMIGLLVGVCVALLVVTALGIVGLGSFWVAQRRRQIGVRRALGATRANILHYFQTENFILTTVGIAAGAALAYGVNGLLMQHYELPRLPGAYPAAGAILLWLVGQAAVLWPALRAAAVPPVVATRST
jgi:putative ABC transport system permease protein